MPTIAFFLLDAEIFGTHRCTSVLMRNQLSTQRWIGDLMVEENATRSFLPLYLYDVEMTHQTFSQN
jgi:hypothetical protein